MKITLNNSDYTITLNEVIEDSEGFDEGLLIDHVSNEEKAFSLKKILISDVRDYRNRAIEMTDEMIAANNDTEYIESMTNAVRTKGADCFHPVVVIDRGDHFEWIDGQHRMTALLRAGIKSTMAYIQKAQ